MSSFAGRDWGKGAQPARMPQRTPAPNYKALLAAKANAVLSITGLTSDTVLTPSQLNASFNVDCTAGSVTPTLPYHVGLPEGTYARVIKADVSTNPVPIKQEGTSIVMATLNTQRDEAVIAIVGGVWVVLWQSLSPVVRRVLWVSGAVFKPANKLPGAYHLASAAAGTFNVSASLLDERYEWSNTSTGSVTLDGGTGSSWAGRDSGSGPINVPASGSVTWRRTGNLAFQIIAKVGTIT